MSQIHLSLASRFAALLALSSLWLPVAAQDQPPKPAAPSSKETSGATDELVLKQSQVADKYSRLEELMFKMAALEGASNPRRAALLTRAVEQSKEQLTKAQLETLVKLLGQKQLKRALDEQTAVHADLKALLDLLTSEDRSDRLKSEQARIREYIKEVERLIRLEKSIQGQTEGGGDEKRLAKEQGELAKRTGDLAQKIKENEEGGESKPADESPEGKPSEDKDSKPNEGKPNEGKPSEGKPSEGKPGEGKPGEGKPSDSKPQDSKGKEDKPEEGKPDEAKPQEGKDQKGKPSEGKSKDSKGKAGKPQGGKGKPSEGQPNEGEPMENGESGDQNQQDKQDQQDNPARKRIEQAEQKMRDAQKKLEEAKRKESIEDQRQAKEELEKAKAELEEILRQLREEEIARTLAMLEARFKTMLEMQLKVYESTRRLDQVTVENRSEQFVVQAGKLAIDERKIAIEAQKALTLLEEEGSSVAFPATVEAMHEDMEQAANRLADTKIDEITIGIEEDIIAALEEMIEALQKAQQDAEKQKQQQQQQQPQQEQEKPLVDAIAELKMIKALQERVNKRTVRYARLLEDDQDPVGQAESAELVDALKKLSERQQDVFRITRDIVLGKNK